MTAQPALNIVAGQKLLLRDETFTVDKIRDDVLYLDDGKQVKTMPCGDVAAAFASGALRRAEPRGVIDEKIEKGLREIEVSKLTPAERQRALRMLQYVDVLRAQPRGRRSGEELKQALAQKAQELNDPKPPIERTVYLNKSRLELAGNDIRALVPRIGSRGSRQVKLHPIVESVIDERIKSSYLAPSEISVAQLHRLIEGDIKVENERRAEGDKLSAPNPDAVRRRIEKNYDPYEVMKSRKGLKAADQHFRIVDPGPTYTRPLQMALIDATELDVMIVDSFGGPPIRPWLTLVVDAFSRCILGFHLSFAPPSRETTNQALRHAFGCKAYLTDRYPNIRSGYPCFGLPEAIRSDNGREFKNEDVRFALSNVGVDADFNPAGKPQYKGAVERLFRTLNQGFVHMLPGTTRSNVHDLGDHEPIKTARMSYAQLLEAFHIWVCDIYHNARHRELGESPLAVWLHGTEKHPIEPPPSDEELCVLLGNTVTATVQRDGITIDRIVYSAKWLTHLRPAPGADGQVLVRYDPSDLSRVWVYDEFAKRYFEVPASEKYREYAKGLSWWVHQQVKKSRALVGRDKYTGELLARARRDLHQRFAETAPKDRKKARARRRILGEEAAMGRAVTSAARAGGQALSPMNDGIIGESENPALGPQSADEDAAVRSISELETRPGFGAAKRSKRECPNANSVVVEPAATLRPKKVNWLDLPPPMPSDDGPQGKEPRI